MIVCDTCHTAKEEHKFNPESGNPRSCFACRVKGVAFTNPIKSGQGDDQWRHSTIAESARIQVAEAASNGLEAVPKYTAGGYTPSKKQMEKLSGKQ